MFTFRNVRILFAAALLAAIFCLAGCSTAAQAVPQPAETSRSAEATPETAAPAPTSTPAPTATPEPTPAAIVPTSVTLDQEGGILNRGMTWTLRATVLPEDAADKTVRWTSSDESVATIDDAGVITALHPGQTTITAASEAGGVSTTYTLLVQEVATCSYCGGTGHTASACPSKAAAEQTQAASVAQQAAEPAAPADWAGRRIYSQGDADIPEGGVVQRPDGSRYIKGPLNVIFGYDSCPEDTDLSQPGNTPFTGDCVFCGDYGHDVYHCPILAAEQDPDAFCGD